LQFFGVDLVMRERVRCMNKRFTGGTHNQVETTDLGKSELLLLDTRGVDLLPYPMKRDLSHVIDNSDQLHRLTECFQLF
jgi:hypothetical protein